MPILDAIKIESKVRDRVARLEERLKRDCPECFTEQKHLDSRTIERNYWHYGYLCALRDVLRLIIGSPNDLSN